MREIEIQLNMDRAYDPNSRDFMFGQGEIEISLDSIYKVKNFISNYD